MIIANIFEINKNDKIVIYDNSDVISSCRIWYTFLYFNHNPNLVSVLDGGLKKWLQEKKTTFIHQCSLIRTGFRM